MRMRQLPVSSAIRVTPCSTHRGNRFRGGPTPPSDASLLNRSGLQPLGLEPWIAQTARLVASTERPVIPSVIPGDLGALRGLVQRVVADTECAGLELNIGAPHGAEAVAGALSLERDEDRIGDIVGDVRSGIDVPLWVKLTGQTDRVPQMAAAAFNAGADAVTLITRHMAMLPDLETQSPTLGTVLAYGGGWALPITCRWLALTRPTRRAIEGAHRNKWSQNWPRRREDDAGRSHGRTDDIGRLHRRVRLPHKGR